MRPGGFRRLQNDCDLTSSGRVGSIPTRSRHGGWTVLGIAAASSIIVMAGAAPGAAGAQPPDSARAAQQGTPRRAAPDSLRPPISPGRAFLYSFFMPGLGQARLQRYAAGAVYVTVEAIAVAMASKSANDLRIARQHVRDVVINRYQTDPATGAPLFDAATGKYLVQDTVQNRFDAQRVKARRTQVEDWLAALAFNHLFAGADAFVAAQLWDLPAQVGLRAAPKRASVELRLRW